MTSDRKVARRPTQAQANKLLLALADRMLSVAKTLELAATVDIHRKNGLVGYLQSESSNIKSFVEREPRLL